MAKRRPLIGITMGDPSGIGPEICIKALSDKKVYDISRPVIIGDAKVIDKAAGMFGVDIEINQINKPDEGAFVYGKIDVLHMDTIDMSELIFGQVSAASGKAAFLAVKKAIGLAMLDELDATVTGPINKEALNLAGYHFAGHTEIYAHYTNTKEYTMLLAEGNLRVVHVSTHVSLREACDLVKKDRVLSIIVMAEAACRSFGISKPRIGVAGLNPHAGENGLFGSEETDEIIPAVYEARKRGIDASGPIPADTLFSKAKGGMYDIVVAMYHDQGHIPLKLTGFTWDESKNQWEALNGVNITLGLPIIRTSVDHGTAFDIAWSGIAQPKSMLTAIEYAVRMADERRKICKE